MSSPRQTENKRPVDRCTDVLRSEDKSKDVWKMPESAKTPPAAAGEQVDKDLSQKTLHSRREPAAETTTASSKQDLMAVVDTCTNGATEREEVLSLHKAGSLCMCRLSLTRVTWSIPELDEVL